MSNDKVALDEKPIPEVKTTPADYSTFSKLLPCYDGNKRTLAFYIEGVENALELITNKDDDCIACLIRNKLTGKAVEALSENPGTKTWSDIKDVLKKKFGEFRTEIQLVQELMLIKRDNSTIDAFGDKIRALMCTLISANPEKRIYYEQMALETFLDKLNPITAILIKLKYVQNLDQAITVAKQEEVKLRARRNEQSKPNSFKPSVPYNKPNKPGSFQKKFTNKTPNNSEQTKKIYFQNEGEDSVEENDIPEQETEDVSEEVEDENFLTDLENQLVI